MRCEVKKLLVNMSLVVATGAFVAPHAASLADEPALQVTRYTIDGGGNMRAIGGLYELSGTIGQPEAGRSTGGDYHVSAAFWFPVLPGDSGEDGTVDLSDYAAFQACSTGPDGGTPTEECQSFDVNHSGTIDLADFAVIQTSYTG